MELDEDIKRVIRELDNSALLGLYQALATDARFVESMVNKSREKLRRPALTAEQAHQLRERAAAGERKSPLAKEFGISRETVYSYLRTETVTS
jgi:DNA invertase Pin-like site-specific DNA recombinase